MTILLTILTIGLMISLDIKKVKSPFDNELKEFDIKSDWWNLRWDNVIPMFFSGLIGGAILATEIGVPIVHWIAVNQLGLDDDTFLQNIAISGMELTAVFATTILFIRFFNKKE